MIGRWFIFVALFLSVIPPWRLIPALVSAAPLSAPVARAHLPMWKVLVASNSTPVLAHPAGLAIDQRGQSIHKWMYLANTGNNQIIKDGTGGHYLGSWGSRGTGPGQFQQPTGVAVDGRGAMYVADTGNDRIDKFGPRGQFLTQWGMTGAGPGQFNGPAAVAVGGAGNVFVADRVNRRIEKFSPAGRLLAIWPVSIPTTSNPTGYGPAGPYALTLDAKGDIYTAVDTGQCSGGHCVMDFILLETLSPTGTVTGAVVGSNPYGRYSYQPVPGVTGTGPWWQIGGLTLDPRGHLFLAEWNPGDQASVTELTPSARLVGQWELPKPSGARGWFPQGIAIDPRGNVYVADTLANRVLKLVFRP